MKYAKHRGRNNLIKTVAQADEMAKRGDE